MKGCKLMFLFFFCVLFSFAFALTLLPSLELSTQKTVYSPYERVRVSAVVRNPLDYSAELTLFGSISHNRGLSGTMVEEKTIKLMAGEEKEVQLFSFDVLPSFLEGTYTANAVLSLGKEELARNQTSFSVSGTTKLISLTVSLCESPECLEEGKTVFLPGEKAFIKAESDPSDAEIRIAISTPSKQLEFNEKTALIELSETGSYSLSVEASKEGYANATTKKNFAVIKELPSFPKKTVCNRNGKCDENETYVTCPMDCLQEKTSKAAGTWLVFFLAGIGAMIILLGIYFLKARK